MKKASRFDRLLRSEHSSDLNVPIYLAFCHSVISLNRLLQIETGEGGRTKVIQTQFQLNIDLKISNNKNFPCLLFSSFALNK